MTTEMSQECATFAEDNGWSYEPRATYFNQRFTDFPFGNGVHWQRDMLHGNFGGSQCATYLHHNVSGSEGIDDTRREFRVTLLELPLYLPVLEVIPQTIAERLAKAGGAMDIHFESAAFNSLWRVRATDVRYAHDMLDPRMMECLLKPENQGSRIRFYGHALMILQNGPVGIEGLTARLRTLTEIASLIPEHVRRAYASPYWEQQPEPVHSCGFTFHDNSVGDFFAQFKPWR